jgi:hypothetical protein
VEGDKYKKFTGYVKSPVNGLSLSFTPTRNARPRGKTPVTYKIDASHLIPKANVVSNGSSTTPTARPICRAAGRLSNIPNRYDKLGRLLPLDSYRRT